MLLKREGVVGETVGVPTVPFQAVAAQVEVKHLHQTVTLEGASKLAAKVVDDHLPSGLGRRQMRMAEFGVESPLEKDWNKNNFSLQITS